MSPSARHARTTPPNGGNTFTSTLRFELVDEEERALLGSYAIATLLGVAFLLLIQFGPRPIPIEIRPFGPIIVGFPDRTPIPARNARAAGSRSGSSAGSTSAPTTGAISNAFGAAAVIGQPFNILGSVAIAPAGSATAGSGGKTVLAPGEGGVGSTTPGRGGIQGTAGGNGIGGVAGGGNVARAGERVAMPATIRVDQLPVGGDVSALGTYVRGHESQLRFCYQENGLAANPNLAGSITVAIVVAGSGSVADAAVTKRTWAGPGAAESEACILRAIRGWRLPASDRARSTYSFPFNFSR